MKVPKEVHNHLKSYGKGIGKALEIMMRTQEKVIAGKLEEVQKVGSDIADILFEQGFFDIRVVGTAIENIDIDDSVLTIRGHIAISIENPAARQQIYELLTRSNEEEQQHAEPINKNEEHAQESTGKGA